MLEAAASAAAGLGLCHLPDYLCRRHVEEGRLVELLSEYTGSIHRQSEVRVRFTALEDGTVRQFAEQFNSETKSRWGKQMRHVFRIIVPAAFAAIVVATALAQEEPAAPPPPPQPFCANNPGFSDFDFWVGEWNVFSNDEARQFQGTNSITKHYNSCLLKEEWSGAQGGGGFSVNYYNSVKDEWRQVWVANGYSIDYTGGLNEDGAMVLNGHIYVYRRNAATPFRGIWTPQEDGSVIQHFDLYDEDTDAWNVWFEGVYVKKEDPKVSH